ncbi:unnamed protein product [Camellia sinensis]
MMSNQTSRFLFLIFFILIAEHNEISRFAEGGKRRIHITDDLDDVVDDEEDEAWKQWGKKSPPPRAEFDPPPMDFSNMDLPEMQNEMLKRQLGPVFGFVKLRLDVETTRLFGVSRKSGKLLYDWEGTWVVRRRKDVVSDIAMKWTQLSRTGSIETKFMGFDLNTIMFTMEKGQDASELGGRSMDFGSYIPRFHTEMLKEFVLNQSEAYEIKIGDQVFRRPGDPPLEEVIEKLKNERNKEGTNPTKDEEHRKDEL